MKSKETLCWRCCLLLVWVGATVMVQYYAFEDDYTRHRRLQHGKN
jgi:hypothetical protein